MILQDGIGTFIDETQVIYAQIVYECEKNCDFNIKFKNITGIFRFHYKDKALAYDDITILQKKFEERNKDKIFE